MYLSFQGLKGRYPLYKTRELTDTDIIKLANWPSWPHFHAIYFVLGKMPIGDFSEANVDPATPKELSERYYEILERFHADRIVGGIDAPEASYVAFHGTPIFNVKPVEFVL